MANVLERIPVREQDPKVRAANFDEVCLGYNEEEIPLIFYYDKKILKETLWINVSCAVSGFEPWGM